MVLIEILLASESFYMVSTISFTCLVIIEFLNIFTEVVYSFYSVTQNQDGSDYQYSGVAVGVYLGYISDEERHTRDITVFDGLFTRDLDYCWGGMVTTFCV